MIKLTTQQLRAAAKHAADLGEVELMLNDPDVFALSTSAQYKLAGQTFFITLEQARAALVERRAWLMSALGELGIEWNGHGEMAELFSKVVPYNPIPQPEPNLRRR